MIIVGVDGSPGGASALAWGLDEAARRGCDIVAVRAWTDTTREGAMSTAFRARAELRVLGQDVDDVVRLRSDHPKIEGRLAEGDPSDALMEMAGEYEADLLVVGRRGLGRLDGLLAGSVSHHCANHAGCAVVVVPPSFEGHDCQRIVVGIEDSPESAETLQWAVEAAQICSARLVAVHVFPRRVFDDVLAAYAEAADTLSRVVDKAFPDGAVQPTFDRLLLEGRPATELLDQAAGADLLVVGASSHPGIATVLGSVAMECLEHSPVPIVIRRESSWRAAS